MVLVDVDLLTQNFHGVCADTKTTNPVTSAITYNRTINTGTTRTITANIARNQYPNPTTPTGYGTYFEDRSLYTIFEGITIPQFSTIDDATFNFSMSVGTPSVGTIKLYGRKTSNPVTPTSYPQTFFTKPRASANQTISFSGTPTTTQQTPFAVDVQAIVQELVNTFDYNNENMMFIMRRPLVAPTPTGFDTFSAQFDSIGSASVPNLTINYSEPAGLKSFSIDAILFIRKEEFTIDARLASIAEFTIDAFLLGEVHTIRPISDISIGSWTDTRLGNDDGELWDELDEVTPDDNTTAITATGSGSFEVKLESAPDPGFHFGHTVYVRAKVENDNGSSRNIVIQLFQGATLIASENQPVLTESYVTYSMTLTETQASNITDYSDLRVRVTET